jgi:hypothetical protein
VSPTSSHDAEKGPMHRETIAPLSPREKFDLDGLRTYGDDEDHDHEPPVCTSLMNHGGPCIQATDIEVTANIQTGHESGSHGFLVDWKPDPSLSIR